MTTKTDALRVLRAASRSLTRQQLLTLLGQVLSGDVDAAMRGLRKITERRAKDGLGANPGVDRI